MTNMVTQQATLTDVVSFTGVTDDFIPTAVPKVIVRRPDIRPDTFAVLVPCHNEADQIGDTVRSLMKQTRPPDKILVISDNSTDNTAQVAYRAGAEVVRTSGNTFKKAGALNAGIRQLMCGSYFPESVMTIDGDTILEPHCVERAMYAMSHDRGLGGLSVVCRGKPDLVKWPTRSDGQMKAGLLAWKHPWLMRAHPNRWLVSILLVWLWLCALGSAALVWLQRAEFARAEFVRLRRSVHTLSGAGTIMRSTAIFELLDERHGKLFHECSSNLVEDFEVTLALKRLWNCANNCYLVAFTDLMTNLRALLRQRLRWVGGTISELRRQGWRPETRTSVMTMVYGFVGMPVYYLWIYLLVCDLMTQTGWHDLWFTAFVGLYQAISLHKLGRWSMLVGFLLVPECLYMVFRHFWMLLSLVCSYLGLLKNW